jgi:drug/metabolite transporter (DMT)-like permease
MNSSRLATLSGFGAILLWSSLALMTAGSGTVPPFQLAAMTFLIGGLVGLVPILLDRKRLAAFRQPWPVWLLGVGGLFGYHAFYFSALRLAPPAEAGLISYLWPLLIVLMSALLPGEKLRLAHIGGALFGFSGVVLLIGGRAGGFTFDPAYTTGYLLALCCAFIWSGYSVLSRRFSAVPTDAVAAFCLVTAILSFLAHTLLETTIWPDGLTQWLAVLGLGLGPVGAAFYVWDHGVKHGDIRLLGVASYAAPVLSTLILILAGFAEPTLSLAAATALIVTGALLASWQNMRRKAH